MTQYAVPIFDLLNSTFTLTGGATLHDVLDDGIDGGVPDDDTTKAFSSTVADFLSCALTPILDPHVNTGHILKIRVKDSAAAVVGTVNFRLRQGGQQILSQTSNLTTGWTTISVTLSSAQADSITNYANLEVRVAYQSAGIGGGLNVSACEFQCPDPSLDSLAVPDALGHAA